VQCTSRQSTRSAGPTMNKTSHLKAAFALLCSLLGASAFANEALWRDVDPNDIANRGQRWVAPQQARTVELNFGVLRNLLQQAPMEGQLATRASPVILSLPMPDGQFARFALVESPVMEAALAAKFPDIRTYAGQGLDDANATLRLDITPKGFHAQVLGSSEFYIDPYQVQDEYHYVVYSRRGFGDSGKQYRCGTDGSDPHLPATLPAKLAGGPTPNNPAGSSLRTYRTAIAATSSYTNAFGGTVADGIAGLTTMVNRLNGIFEREFALRLVLVANNDLIVYTNSNVGPIGVTPTSPSVTIQNTINNAIGIANYDLGHAVGGSGGGGAIVPLGNVCGTSKARGYTSLNPPRGDIFDIDFVAHELGHQLGGSHTWNGCGGGGQWTATAAMEPGSGTTIMAYAGICPDNLLPNSDAYFHARSFTQIWQIINNGGPGNGNTVCGTTTPTGNDPPNLTAPANMTMPERTPFQLTAAATDPNVGDVLTYNWEQVDTGPQGSPSATGDNVTAPLFRSFPASTSPTRIFPSLRYILDNANQPPATITLPPAAGTYLPGEILPNPATGTRVMNFRVTARDGRAGGGGLGHSADVLVTAVADVGPFLVGNVTGEQTGGASLAVTWSVANTDLAPVSTTQVNILISLDGGYTFETLLANTPNDGAQSVTLPDIDTSRARIKIEAANGTGIAAGNTYFDITDGNFQIDAGGTPVTVTVSLAPADLIVTQQGSPAPATRNIATIADGIAPFSVTADTYPPNPELTIQSLQVTGNTVSATAAASCLLAAPNLPSFRTYPAVLWVVDSTGSQASAVFPINVSNNSIPTLGTYTTRTVAAGASTTATPTAAPADANSNQSSVTVSPTTLPGGGTVSVAPNGVVSITTTAGTTLGNYPVTVSVSDSCGAQTSKSFTLRVLSPNPLLGIGPATVTSGNAILEPRECNTLNVAVGNSGGTTATVVSAVLSSVTPGVSIAQGNSTYPNIPTDGSQVNDIAYQVSTAPSMVCGTSVAFTHTVNYSGGPPTVLNFNLPIGGPPATNYNFVSETGTTAPTGSTLVTGSQDDNVIVPVTLPGGFAFQVYGTPVTQLRADTNGVLVFNVGTVSSSINNGALPSAAYAAPSLFPFWDDLDLRTTVATGGGIYTQVTGVAPNRSFDIQWRAVRFVSGAATPVAPTIVFTVRLFETTNRIEVFYTTVIGNGGGASGSSATVGIQAAGTGTVLTSFSVNTPALSAGQKLTVTRAIACTVGTNVCGELPNNVFANGFE